MTVADQENGGGAAAAWRARSIKRAVATSMASKAGTAMLQLVSVPIAVRVLGREEFGLYASISMVITTMILLEVGVGPALVHGLSGAAAKGDRRREREYASTSFYLMIALAVLGCLALGAAALWMPAAVLFGEAFSAHGDGLRSALLLGVLLFGAVFVLSHTERAREGYLEVSHNNLYGAAGNLVAAAAVGVGVWFFPNIHFLLLAVFGPQVLAKLANTWALWRSRRHLAPSPRAFRPRLAQSLLKDGLAFSAAYSVVGIVEYNLATNLVGRAGGPADAAAYSVLVSLCIMALGFVVMVTTPTWPAVVDARARGDLAWVRAAARRLYAFALAVGLAALVALAGVGTLLLPLWLGDEFRDIGRATLCAFGVYFLAHVWRHVNHVLLMGIGEVGVLARVQLVESGLVLVPVWAGLSAWGLAGAFWGMAGAIALITGWLLPRIFWGALRLDRIDHRLEGEAQESAAVARRRQRSAKGLGEHPLQDDRRAAADGVGLSAPQPEAGDRPGLEVGAAEVGKGEGGRLASTALSISKG